MAILTSCQIKETLQFYNHINYGCRKIAPSLNTLRTTFYVENVFIGNTSAVPHYRRKMALKLNI